MFKPRDGAYGAPHCEGFCGELHHQRESLVRNLPNAGKEPPGRRVQADWDREQLVQKVHHSVLVNLNQTEPLEPRERFNPGGKVDQEGEYPPYGLSLRRKWPALLPNGSKLARQSFHKVARDTADCEYPPPPTEAEEGGRGQPWQLGGGLPSARGVTVSHEACAWASR